MERGQHVLVPFVGGHVDVVRPGADRSVPRLEQAGGTGPWSASIRFPSLVADLPIREMSALSSAPNESRAVREISPVAASSSSISRRARVLPVADDVVDHVPVWRELLIRPGIRSAAPREPPAAPGRTRRAAARRGCRSRWPHPGSPGSVLGRVFVVGEPRIDADPFEDEPGAIAASSAWRNTWPTRPSRPGRRARRRSGHRPIHRTAQGVLIREYPGQIPRLGFGDSFPGQ